MNSYEILLKDIRFGRVLVNAESEDEAKSVALETREGIEWHTADPVIEVDEVFQL